MTTGSETLMTTTKAEQETIIRYDQEERVASLWTAYPRDARRWEELGYEVSVHSRTQEGTPRSWSARVPIDAIRWRPVRDGVVVRRKGHRKGRLIGVATDELVASDEQREEGTGRE